MHRRILKYFSRRRRWRRAVAKVSARTAMLTNKVDDRYVNSDEGHEAFIEEARTINRSYDRLGRVAAAWGYSTELIFCPVLNQLLSNRTIPVNARRGR